MPRIAVAQILNTPDPAFNQAAILQMCVQATDEAAELILFPECALSGFQAKLAIEVEDDLAALLSPVHAVAANSGLCIVLPTQIPQGHGQAPLNGGYIITQHGLQRFAKHGLTESERQYFEAPESPGKRQFTHNGHRYGVVVCREVEDEPSRYLSSPPDILLWPGYWRWEDGEGWGPQRADGSPNHAYQLQSALGCAVVQANFCANQSADSRGVGPSGGSVVVAADGRLLGRGAVGQAPNLMVVDLP